METPDYLDEPLAERSLPQVAAALRARLPSIVERWRKAVADSIPDADPLTVQQVLNSLPRVMEYLAKALESDRPRFTKDFAALSIDHGVVRFHEEYDVKELIIEYRILRKMVIEELAAEFKRPLEYVEAMAIHTGIDIALQKAVTAFVEHQQTQIKSAVETRSRYLSFLSHDLRNNLNSVTLSMEVLALRLGERSEFNEEIQDLRGLQRSLEETIEGMDRLLQAERLRHRSKKFEYVSVELSGIVDDLLPAHRRRAQEKGLMLESAIPADAVVIGDRELIMLVLQNLIGNAIKFSERGAVRIGARRDGGKWTVSVKDQGPGIASEVVTKLFDAFTRGETHGQSGVGLGLTIASQAAGALGSDLRIESTVGEGSIFYFSLPAAEK